MTQKKKKLEYSLGAKFKEILQGMRAGDEIFVQAHIWHTATRNEVAQGRRTFENKLVHKSLSYWTDKDFNRFRSVNNNLLAALERGYIERDKTFLESKQYSLTWRFVRTSKEIRTRKRGKRKGLYKYQFEMSIPDHKKYLEKNSPWLAENRAFRKLGMEPTWGNGLWIYMKNMGDYRKSLYHHFIENAKSEGYYPWMTEWKLLYHILDGELILTAGMVELSTNKKGELYFRTLTAKEAMAKWKKLVDPRLPREKRNGPD